MADSRGKKRELKEKRMNEGYAKLQEQRPKKGDAKLQQQKQERPNRGDEALKEENPNEGDKKLQQEKRPNEGDEKLRQDSPNEGGESSARSYDSDDSDFLLLDGTKADRKVWEQYLRDLEESEGFDISVYPGASNNSPIFPYGGHKSDPEKLRRCIELCNLAIQCFNSRNNTMYEFVGIVNVNASISSGIHYYLTFQAIDNDEKTFEALVWDRIDGTNDVELCRLKKSRPHDQECPDEGGESNARSYDYDSDDSDFLLLDGTKADRKVWEQYLRDLDESEGFDISVFPGASNNSLIFPYGGHKSNPEKLRRCIELCKSAIQYFNSQNNTVYEFVDIVNINASITSGIHYYFTFRAIDTDEDPKTFQAFVWEGFDGTKDVELCRLKNSRPRDQGDGSS